MTIETWLLCGFVGLFSLGVFVEERVLNIIGAICGLAFVLFTILQNN